MMNIDTIDKFFLWCMLVNAGIYALTAVASLLLRDFICRLQAKMFGLGEETIRKSIYTYIAGYKLLITVFNFAPWVAIQIIK